MSEAPHWQDTINPDGSGIGDDPYPPHSAPNLPGASQGMSNFVDSSGPIFSMYLQMAEEEDKKMTENWKADADGVLIFTGLFSASVATLVSVSVQDIRPNPQDTSNFYLANIYRTLADPGSNISSSLPSSPPPFSPPQYAVWVNALWFLSLVISITCALLATLLQQWARRYLKVTQPRYSLDKRARIRAFFFEGVGKFFLPLMVEALPTLLHVSLFLFFSGLLIFLWNVNLTIFKLVLSGVSVCTIFYGCHTFMPIIWHDSPCLTPFSSWVWLSGSLIRYAAFESPVLNIRTTRLLVRNSGFAGIWARIRGLSVRQSRDRVRDFPGLWARIRESLNTGMQKTAEKTALLSPSEIFTRAFMWTFDSLDEDHELERFFSGLPGFRNSTVVKDPLLSLTSGQKERLSMTLIGLFDRTFSSDLLSEPTKNLRAIICAKALDPAEFPYAYRQIIDRILFDDRFRGLQTAEFGRAIRGWGGGGDREAALVRAIFVSIVARGQGHDYPWFIFASNAFGVPESDLRDYITRGDSWSLDALIHITCQQFHHTRNLSWPAHDFSKVLESASKFNVQNTSPELRHKFCSLWNQIVRDARRDNNRRMVRLILKPIYDVYTALHPVADSHPPPPAKGDGDYVPSSYPLCDIPDHHADPIPQAHDHYHDASASVSFAHIPLRDNTALPLAPLASPDAPSSSVSALRPDVSSLAGDIYVPGPFNAARQTAVEPLRIPATFQNPVAVRVIQDSVNASTTTIPLSAMEHSVSTPPAARPGVVAVRHIADRGTSSDVLDVPSLPPPTSVLPTGLQSSLYPPITGSDYAYSSPGPHLLLMAPAASSRPHPRLSSARDLGAAVEGEGSAKATVRKRKEKDTLYPSSAIRKNIITTPDLPPQLPPPPPATNVATASPSRRPLTAEHTRDKPPYPSLSHHDIV